MFPWDIMTCSRNFGKVRNCLKINANESLTKEPMVFLDDSTVATRKRAFVVKRPVFEVQIHTC